MNENVIFTGKNNFGFSAVLKERVKSYFQTNGISNKCNALMVLKTVFYLGGFFTAYIFLMFGHLTELSMLGLAMCLGFFISGIGFNIGHDAVHGAYSSNRLVNKILSYCFDLTGACSYTWKIRHTVIHHTYTNIIGSDGDLESMPLLRFCVKPGRKFFHQIQHWYAPILYGFVTIVWVFKKDFKHMWEEGNSLHSRKKPPASAYFSLIFFKVLHYVLFLVLPFFVLNLAFWKILLGFFAMHFVAGILLAFVFQLGHCVEGPAFIHPTLSNTVSDSWAEHQLKSTSNFEPRFFATWICGGLNYQIEHHLFPNICHIHYPALSSIVQRTAKEFNLPYYFHKSFYQAFRSHLRMLKYFGRTDPVYS